MITMDHAITIRDVLFTGGGMVIAGVIIGKFLKLLGSYYSDT